MQVPFSAAPVKRSQFFPLQNAIGIHFEKGNAEKAVSKIKELNVASAVLTEKDLVELDAIVATLKATSRYHATSFSELQIQILIGKVLTAWNFNDRFAVYDLIRAMLVHPDGGAKFKGKRGEQLFSQACASATAKGATQPLILTSLRVACNLFRTDVSVQAALTAASDATINPIELVASSNLVQDADPNVRLVLGTLFFNCANAMYHKKPRSERDNAVLSQCVRGAVALLTAQPTLDDDGAFRAACSVGCAGLVEAQIVRNLASSISSCGGPKVQQVIKDISEFVK